MKVYLLHNCSAGLKGNTVEVNDSFARRLNESGDGKIIREAKAQTTKATSKKQVETK